MRAISVEQFLSTMPELVSDISHVVIATYNNLSNCKAGGEFSVNGKKVTVLCGGAAYANLAPAPGVTVPNNGALATKAAGVKVISDGLTQVEPGTLAILYAGQSRFDDIVGLAYRLAGRQVKVVLVSCGCDADAFDDLESEPNITCVVPTDGCNGGRGDLARILEELMR